MDRSIEAGSESKKRLFEESEEFEESGPKKVKIRDLESVFRSEALAIDLNAKDDAPSCVEDTILSQSKINCVKSRGLAFDLNSENVSLSECGSSCNMGGEGDSMRVWKEMKRNGFLSSSHGGVPVIPKPRGRKKGKESVIKKKIEIAKKEQVDRFAKVAAPSGLLNELNPGIINHVRNRKQVHSIIENLVRSARSESKHDVGKECCEDVEHNDEDVVAFNKLECEDDVLALKLLSSGTMTSNASSLSHEESGNVSTVNSLSLRAANVASQWLELLHQDLKGRLAALRRSRKRVQSTIQRELPLLVSRELVFNQENNNSENDQFDKGNADLHRTRWGLLFYQMDNALSEEEKQLESSLNQVNEMLMHCENGLLQFHPENGLQRRTNDYRNLKAESSDYKDLAVQAAAAAIYSTTNFLQSMENLPCF